jgi:hypothetical protein
VESGKTGFDRMNRMNRIEKKKLKNGSEHEADLPRKSAFAKSHPVNPVHPVQNVFRVAARRSGPSAVKSSRKGMILTYCSAGAGV